jgi:hypothetical protein
MHEVETCKAFQIKELEGYGREWSGRVATAR